MSTPPTMPCAHDQSPLRITLFPEYPQTILVYVPSGQSLWLPTLPTPFDLDVVCDALDAHDVPHDTREGDRNRWWRNLKQSESAEQATRGQQQREAEAARHVQIHLSSTSLEKQRSEVVLMNDDEIRQLKVRIGQAKTNAATRGIYEPPAAFRSREKRLADLQTTSVALQKKLGELRELRQQQHQQQQHQQAASAPRAREERFVQKAKRHLSRDQFMAIWAEIEAEDAMAASPAMEQQP